MCYSCDGDAKKEAKRIDRREKTKIAAGDSRYLSTSLVNFTSLLSTAMTRRFKSIKNSSRAIWST